MFEINCPRIKLNDMGFYFDEGETYDSKVCQDSYRKTKCTLGESFPDCMAKRKIEVEDLNRQIALFE